MSAKLIHQTNDGNYPDTRYIVCGYFLPKDATRCCVCGRENRTEDSTCGKRCHARMCAIQRQYTDEDVDRWLAALASD